MLTKTIDVREVQVSLEELLSLVIAGTEIIFAQDSTPIARLVPIVLPTTLRMAGLHAGAIWMSDDFIEPLPEEFWTGGGRCVGIGRTLCCSALQVPGKCKSSSNWVS